VVSNRQRRRLIYVASPLSSLPFHSIKKSGREPLLPCDIESWVSRRLHSRSTSVSADITCAMSTVSLRNDPRHYVVRRCVCASFSSIARHIHDCLYTANPATAMSRLTTDITCTMSTVSLRNDPRHYVVRRCVCASFSWIARHIPDCLHTANPATAMSRLTKLITSTRWTLQM